MAQAIHKKPILPKRSTVYKIIVPQLDLDLNDISFQRDSSTCHNDLFNINIAATIFKAG